MTGRFGALLLLAAATVGLAASIAEAPAATVQKRFYLQVRNVKAGEALRLEITNAGVLGILVDDIRLSGLATHLNEGEVAVDGTVLTISPSAERLSLNLTLQAVCSDACPAELSGTAWVPFASYAMLRTRAADATLTASGAWRVKLSGG